MHTCYGVPVEVGGHFEGILSFRYVGLRLNKVVRVGL